MTTVLKALRFPLVLLAIEALVIATIATLYSIGAHRLGVPTRGPANLAGAVGLAALVISAHKLLRRWLEGAADTDFAAPRVARELCAGLLGGALLFSLAAALVALLGGLRIESLQGFDPALGQFWPMASMAVASGVLEETLFRGILLRHLEAMLGSWLALVITALLFGLAHLMNPHASLFAALAIGAEAGILLGAAYLLTRRLWFAIGIHAAWNFTQGWVFSIPVSGSAGAAGLLVTRRDGPDWLTGGGFGLEASVVALVAATVAGILLLRRAAKLGRLVSPPWRR